MHSTSRLRTRRTIIFWALLLFVVVTDYATKRWAEAHLSRGIPREVVGDVARLRLTYNTGAVFGIAVGPAGRWLLIAIAVGILALLINLHRRSDVRDAWRTVAIALLCAGALGNLYDRVRSGKGVVDFIDIGVGSVRFWTFNVADAAVTVGAIMLAISLWREDRREARSRVRV